MVFYFFHPYAHKWFLLPPFRFPDLAWVLLTFFEVKGKGKERGSRRELCRFYCLSAGWQGGKKQIINS